MPHKAHLIHLVPATPRPPAQGYRKPCQGSCMTVDLSRIKPDDKVLVDAAFAAEEDNNHVVLASGHDGTYYAFPCAAGGRGAGKAHITYVLDIIIPARIGHEILSITAGCTRRSSPTPSS